MGRQGPVDTGQQRDGDGARMTLVFALARAYEFFENCALSSGLSPVYSCLLRLRGRTAVRLSGFGIYMEGRYNI